MSASSLRKSILAYQFSHHPQPLEVVQRLLSCEPRSVLKCFLPYSRLKICQQLMGHIYHIPCGTENTNYHTIALGSYDTTSYRPTAAHTSCRL